jgi:hypothetical protein
VFGLDLGGVVFLVLLPVCAAPFHCFDFLPDLRNDSVLRPLNSQ